MLKIVKVGGLTVGAGVLVGVAAIGWLRWQAGDAAPVASRGGSVVLDASSTPGPEPDSAGSLHVTSPSSVAAAGGAASSLLGGTPVGNGGSGGGSEPTPEASNSVPSPDSFAQYDQYRDDKTALFGDILVGKGAEVVAGSTVIVHYRGWLTNGKQFDESYSTGNPISFKEGEHKVVAGFEQGVLGMKAGGKRRLIVPPSVGYGADGHGPVPANAVMVFDVELVAVQ